MSLWNNPQNDSLKVVLLVIVVIVAGYFIFKSMQSNSLQSTGRVIDTSATSPTAGFLFSTTANGVTCATRVCSESNQKQCLSLSGTVSKDNGQCVLDQKQATPEQQGLLNIINSGGTATN